MKEGATGARKCVLCDAVTCCDLHVLCYPLRLWKPFMHDAHESWRWVEW